VPAIFIPLSSDFDFLDRF